MANVYHAPAIETRAELEAELEEAVAELHYANRRFKTHVPQRTTWRIEMLKKRLAEWNRSLQLPDDNGFPFPPAA
jgi:hypothetical protein